MTHPPVLHRSLNIAQSNKRQLINKEGVSTLQDQIVPIRATSVPANIAPPTYSTRGVSIAKRTTTSPTRVRVSPAATRFCKSSRFRQKNETVNGVLIWFSKKAPIVPAKSQRVAVS